MLIQPIQTLVKLALEMHRARMVGWQMKLMKVLIVLTETTCAIAATSSLAVTIANCQPSANPPNHFKMDSVPTLCLLSTQHVIKQLALMVVLCILIQT